MPPRKLLVADLVGLTPGALRHAPRIRAMADGGLVTPLATVFPAVTCSVQASFLTGTPPSRHGIVGNGWYFRRLDEVLFWRQSRWLVDGPVIFDTLQARGRTTANLFGWYNWNCGADFSITPKPSYPADGAKHPGIHAEPPAFRGAVEAALGPFPLFDFWGPRAGIVASRWIAAATQFTIEKHAPDFLFCYLPHLDYDHQRFGPDAPQSIAAIAALDETAGVLFENALARGYDIIAFSEYGITHVNKPVFINKILRAQNWLRVRMDPFVGELPLFGTSRAFAVCDHQIAHIYVRDPRDLAPVRASIQQIPGVSAVLDRKEQQTLSIDHPNSGDLVALADENAWFAYNYWLDDALAPDFARTVDIHRKPGYDPAELFTDPNLRFVPMRIALALLKKKLGFRYLMQVIPLDPSMVRGSHGLPPASPERGPVLLGSRGAPLDGVKSVTALRAAIEAAY